MPGNRGYNFHCGYEVQLLIYLCKGWVQLYRGNMITCISMHGNRGYNFHCRYEVQHIRYNYEVQLYNFHIVYSCNGVGNLFM